jgi:hypothetical protein
VCETLSLTLREEHLLRVIENRAEDNFEPRRSEVTGGWRNLHKVELHKLHSWSNIIRMKVKEDEIGRECSMNGEETKFI